MLIKARVAAGDARPGRELLEFVEPLIYNTTTDFRTVEAVSETRARIHEKQRLEKATPRQTGRRRREARQRRHSRYRVSRAVPAASAWRPRPLGAARRHAARALAAARQGAAVAHRIFAAGLGLSVPAPSGTPAAVRRRPPDAHAAARQRPARSAGAQDAPGLAGLPSAGLCSANSISISPACRISTSA